MRVDSRPGPYRSFKVSVQHFRTSCQSNACRRIYVCPEGGGTKKKRLTKIFCPRPEAVFTDGTFPSFSQTKYCNLSASSFQYFPRINTHGPELPQSKLPNYCWRLTRKAMTLVVVMQKKIKTHILFTLILTNLMH